MVKIELAGLAPGVREVGEREHGGMGAGPTTEQESDMGLLNEGALTESLSGSVILSDAPISLFDLPAIKWMQGNPPKELPFSRGLAIDQNRLPLEKLLKVAGWERSSLAAPAIGQAWAALPCISYNSPSYSRRIGLNKEA